MSFDFDLTIENYSLSELEDLFGLVNDNYDSKAVEISYIKLKKDVFSDDSVDKNVYAKTMDFLNEAKKMLLFELNTSYNNSFKKRYDKIIVEELNKPVKDVYEKKIPETPVENIQTQTDFDDSVNNFYPYPIKKPKKTVIRHLNIDTRFRKNYSNTLSSNFQIEFPTIFNINQIKLSSFETPTIYNNISKQLGNYFFSLEIVSTGINYVITIPDGSYTPTSLTNYLNYFITTISDLDGIIQFIYNEDGPGSGHIEICVTGDYKYFYFKLNFQNDVNGHSDIITPLHLKLGWLLGFRNSLYFGKTKYVSDGIVDLSGYKYFYLVIDDNIGDNIGDNIVDNIGDNIVDNMVNKYNGSEDINISKYYISPTSIVTNKNILARISSQNSRNNTNTNKSSIVSTPRDYIQPIGIKKINIKLIDEYGRILDLNNIDYSFCLSFYSYLPVN
uniref:Uncharacterized protein n=1 Tax=viral metagenome TaxID=1070528 RepID=A0A6C0D822_9ZZZZ